MKSFAIKKSENLENLKNLKKIKKKLIKIENFK
jgi:hypothetical protein